MEAVTAGAEGCGYAMVVGHAEGGTAAGVHEGVAELVQGGVVGTAEADHD
jgi:hypothetical protein